MDIRDIKIVRGDTTEPVGVSVCWRWIGQHLPPGTRIDLRCGDCGHRVAADKNTVRFVEAGTRIICRNCLPGFLKS